MIELIGLLQILLLAAAISVALGISAAIRCAKHSRQPDVMFFVERDQRWGWRR